MLIIHGVLFFIAVIKWTFRDSEEYDFELSRYFVPMMVICPGIVFVMPVYFFKTRGMLRGSVASILGLGFIAILTIVGYGSQLIAIKVVWGI